MADAIDIVRKSIDAWNAHDANGVAALVSNDYMFESDTVPAPLRGPDGVRQLVETYVKAFPDIRVEIVETLVSGDHVTTRWRATASMVGI
jgi:ketosteroid isomerase-like protein